MLLVDIGSTLSKHLCGLDAGRQAGRHAGTGSRVYIDIVGARNVGTPLFQIRYFILLLHVSPTAGRRPNEAARHNGSVL